MEWIMDCPVLVQGYNHMDMTKKIKYRNPEYKKSHLRKRS